MRKAQSDHVTGCRPAEACSPQVVCYMQAHVDMYCLTECHCTRILLVETRSYIEQQLTLSRLLRVLLASLSWTHGMLS
jgi:hypothetical protein